MSYYYWDKEFTNYQGETLLECRDKYGFGSQKVPILDVEYIMDVIFLDKRHSFGNSWCLRLYDKDTDLNMPVKLYENNKVYGPCPQIIRSE